jgi:hypothetical protein
MTDLVSLASADVCAIQHCSSDASGYTLPAQRTTG